MIENLYFSKVAFHKKGLIVVSQSVREKISLLEEKNRKKIVRDVKIFVKR